MTEYQLALYFWSVVLGTVVAAPFLLALLEFIVRKTMAKKGRQEESDSRPSLPSIPSWPSSAV